MPTDIAARAICIASRPHTQAHIHSVPKTPPRRVQFYNDFRNRKKNQVQMAFFPSHLVASLVRNFNHNLKIVGRPTRKWDAPWPTPPKRTKEDSLGSRQPPPYHPQHFLQSLDLVLNKSFTRSVPAKYLKQCHVSVSTRPSPMALPSIQFVKFWPICLLGTWATGVTQYTNPPQ